MSNLVKIIHWPEIEQYHKIIFLKLVREDLSFWKKKRESFAKKKKKKVSERDILSTNGNTLD